MPQDVLKFLEEIFQPDMSQWKYDPGYATRVTGSCPPPTNSKLLVSINHFLEPWLSLFRDCSFMNSILIPFCACLGSGAEIRPRVHDPELARIFPAQGGDRPNDDEVGP